jgi:hypothetical protein
MLTNKDLEIALTFKNEEFSSKKSENVTLDLKIEQKDGIIHRQNEMIQSLQTELKDLRKDIEYNKNKLSVSMVQLKDLDKICKQYKTENDKFIDK